jgi:hypothetical protein
MHEKALPEAVGKGTKPNLNTSIKTLIGHWPVLRRIVILK